MQIDAIIPTTVPSENPRIIVGWILIVGQASDCGGLEPTSPEPPTTVRTD